MSVENTVDVREEISSEIASFIDWREKPHWKETALHDFDTCLCDRGKAGLLKRAAANEKRRAYYKTPAGIETKERYRKRADVKRKIINQLQLINVSTKAKLCKETIENLVKML